MLLALSCLETSCFVLLSSLSLHLQHPWTKLYSSVQSNRFIVFKTRPHIFLTASPHLQEFNRSLRFCQPAMWLVHCWKCAFDVRNSQLCYCLWREEICITLMMTVCLYNQMYSFKSDLTSLLSYLPQCSF